MYNLGQKKKRKAKSGKRKAESGKVTLIEPRDITPGTKKGPWAFYALLLLLLLLSLESGKVGKQESRV
jgi:hypothetical protein